MRDCKNLYCPSDGARRHLLFPADLQLELEWWAETGDYTAEELHQLKVSQNHLFRVEPRQGVLAPGARQVLRFSYEHSIPGTDRLPMLLKVDSGREIMVRQCSIEPIVIDIINNQ